MHESTFTPGRYNPARISGRNQTRNLQNIRTPISEVQERVGLKSVEKGPSWTRSLCPTLHATVWEYGSMSKYSIPIGTVSLDMAKLMQGEGLGLWIAFQFRDKSGSFELTYCNQENLVHHGFCQCTFIITRSCCIEARFASS